MVCVFTFMAQLILPVECALAFNCCWCELYLSIGICRKKSKRLCWNELFAWHLLCLISAIQLNKIYFQVVPLTAAVIVTTPQKLAFIDVAKGVRMFSKLKVWFVSSLQSPWNWYTHTHIHGGRNYLYGDENTHEHDVRELKNMYDTCYLYIFMLSIQVYRCHALL